MDFQAWARLCEVCRACDRPPRVRVVCLGLHRGRRTLERNRQTQGPVQGNQSIKHVAWLYRQTLCMSILYQELSVNEDRLAETICAGKDMAYAALCQAGLPQTPDWAAML